jgi:cell division protein FtsB
MVKRWSTVALMSLFVVVQAQLWFGSGGRPYVVKLEQQLAQQQVINATARTRNQRVAAEVGDLKEGLEMVEEKARSELGMIKPTEVFVQILPTQR